MGVSTNKVLDVARALTDGETEEHWRSAASRGYYAAYYRALRLADKYLPNGRVNIGMHARLIERIRAQGPDGSNVARLMWQLKKTRTRADYHTSAPFSRREALRMVRSCSRVVRKLDDFEARLATMPVCGEAVADSFYEPQT